MGRPGTAGPRPDPLGDGAKDKMESLHELHETVQLMRSSPKHDDPVFPSGRSNRHSPPGQFCFVESAVLLRKDLERVGQPRLYKDKPLSFHSPRRTFATMLNQAGVSEAEVGDLLGHGAKSVARGHYIPPEVFERRLENLRKLPLPSPAQGQSRR